MAQARTLFHASRRNIWKRLSSAARIVAAVERIFSRNLTLIQSQMADDAPVSVQVEREKDEVGTA